MSVDLIVGWPAHADFLAQVVGRRMTYDRLDWGKVMKLDDALLKIVQPQYPRAFVDIVQGDCFDKLPEIKPESVHLVVTDPPYFLDGLDSEWRKGKSGPRGTGSVGGLPRGMKFDPRQGRALQTFMNEVGTLMLEAMRPGAFAVVFSQPRLAHRMASGLEDAGFEIRDLLAWRYTRRAQFKAFSMEHFVDRTNASAQEKTAVKRLLRGRKTPQLRPQFESMILAQKPKQGTHVENWIAHETGLIDPNATLDGKAPSTVMTVEKPAKTVYNGHLTVKPVLLVEHLIKLLSLPRQIVLDPFLGSGTTALAAARLERSCIGIEINPDYVNIAEQRLGELDRDLENRNERETGEFRDRGVENTMNDAIAAGTPVELRDTGKVVRCAQENKRSG